MEYTRTIWNTSPSNYEIISVPWMLFWTVIVTWTWNNLTASPSNYFNGSTDFFPGRLTPFQHNFFKFRNRFPGKGIFWFLNTNNLQTCSNSSNATHSNYVIFLQQLMFNTAFIPATEIILSLELLEFSSMHHSISTRTFKHPNSLYCYS
jgi:hypothetical protein